MTGDAWDRAAQARTTGLKGATLIGVLPTPHEAMTDVSAPSSSATSHRPRERLLHLEGSRAALQSRTDVRQEDRNQSRKENQALRRTLTHSRLIDDLLSALNALEAPSGPASPPTVQQFCETLPPTLSFSAFFEAAEEEEFSTEAARRCLKHFLEQGLLHQTGSQLTKAAPAAANA